MKGKTAKNIRPSRTSVTVRVSETEKKHLEEIAKITGVSVSEYLRRRFFGRKPIIAHTDVVTIRELRRLGGLLKHNFETMRHIDAPHFLFEEQKKLLKHLYVVADRIGK